MKKFVRLFICLLIGISFLTFLTFSNLENISVAESEQKTNVVVPNQPELKSELEPTFVSEPQTALSKSATKIARDANPVEITEPLPVITLRFSDIDSLLKIARKIAGIAGVSETQFDKAINFVADNGDDGTGEPKSVGVIGSSLAGLMTDEVSKTKPIGLVVRTNGKEFIDTLFILPIKDLAKFAIPNFPFLQIEKIADGKF
ncbi:MAG: hypothetical protein LBC20_07110, partial [Planctomycetaceae bacterium]|nr:hypothetical protein [Planctomycetaceae bacterium]